MIEGFEVAKRNQRLQPDIGIDARLGGNRRQPFRRCRQAERCSRANGGDHDFPRHLLGVEERKDEWTRLRILGRGQPPNCECRRIPSLHGDQLTQGRCGAGILDSLQRVGDWPPGAHRTAGWVEHRRSERIVRAEPDESEDPELEGFQFRRDRPSLVIGSHGRQGGTCRVFSGHAPDGAR
jgi:hypothetical protein